MALVVTCPCHHRGSQGAKSPTANGHSAHRCGLQWVFWFYQRLLHISVPLSLSASYMHNKKRSTDILSSHWCICAGIVCGSVDRHSNRHHCLCIDIYAHVERGTMEWIIVFHHDEARVTGSPLNLTLTISCLHLSHQNRVSQAADGNSASAIHPPTVPDAVAVTANPSTMPCSAAYSPRCCLQFW
jgi:hypothetical protein